MGDRRDTSKGTRRRQPCLEFIEERLPEFHEAFANRDVRFSIARGRFEPMKHNQDPATGSQPPKDHELPDILPEDNLGDSDRRPFWEEMLPEAMEELKSSRDEPKRLAGTTRSIRGLKGWVDIVNGLEKARANYYDYSGFIGFWKRSAHKMADNVDDGKRLLSLLPNTDYSSVIHCVFDIVFDAAKRTAKIREEIESSLRQFREKLEDVESIVAVYEKEKDIVAAAKKVLSSMLQAIEDIIDYYWAKKGKKMLLSMWQADSYKADLTGCLEDLNSSSARLMEKANIGSFRELRSVNIKASEGIEKLKQLQLDQMKIMREQRRLADAQSEINKSGRKMAAEQQRLASANERNATANQQNAAANMANATTASNAMNAFMRLSQEYLTNLTALNEQKRQNARLAVKYTRLHTQLEAERSRSRDRRPWVGPARVSQAQLLRILNMNLDFDLSAVDKVDMAEISSSAALVNRRDQGKAENLVENAQFKQWVVKTSSTELLVHGDMKPSRTSVTPLSLFSAAIVRNLRQVDRFCAVAFFCGQHTDLDDPLIGGIGLIKSLTAQLLRQHHFDDADLDKVAQEVNLPLLKRGVEDVEELCQLFSVLVRRLRSDTTLFCVIDSVNVYEDEDMLQGMYVEKVLFEILQLTGDQRVKTHVKILFTSATNTNTVWKAFKEKDVLSMHESGRLSLDKHFSDSRFAKQVKGAIEPS
ncbi:uncharacterized protein FFUJ_01979 [Fusarium fujikuroi IMI 58289]|uniref:Uncharacterized protein n=1 Tax=Gibberella fujikuroi (strain CBS 195.34 / IMI 58289 / NRRL A-6831) TaxID=1279085 RepID=S0DJT3_GIBF5|nr:uncharacterized protein FFUJ_01979 [Fusarium fujikuroi IMI 58289]KLO97610.1 uncharacterized protein Y057_6980 [Fusarium fujikuroi]CCT61542.1 uncharacterized protein FFUJ_01979 [Fusarium fujikuroi IMI 58289]SCN74551.1 uncharacterized protein FFC1_02107 [Fusarium fujikuroi]SCO12797.1 uncharacterized protein FFM5_10406 [Fusarium fujikuroi]